MHLYPEDNGRKRGQKKPSLKRPRERQTDNNFPPYHRSEHLDSVVWLLLEASGPEDIEV